MIRDFFSDLYIPFLLSEIEKQLINHKNDVAYHKIISIINSHKDPFYIVSTEKKELLLTIGTTDIMNQLPILSAKQQYLKKMKMEVMTLKK